MLLAIVKYVTIVISSICIILGIGLGIAGIMDKPTADFEAVMLGGIIIFIYAGILVLLYFSNKRKYTPGYWVAFILSLLPIIGTSIFLYIAVKAAESIE